MSPTAPTSVTNIGPTSAPTSGHTPARHSASVDADPGRSESAPLTRAEIAQLLEGSLQEPGPRIGVAVCDLGDVSDAVASRVITTWAGALTDHDVVLPFVDGRRRVVAVIRLRVRSGVEAEALADRLIARASDPIRVDGALQRVRPHVGIAMAVPSDSGTALLDRAFDALETAYGVGGRCWSRSIPSAAALLSPVSALVDR